VPLPVPPGAVVPDELLAVGSSPVDGRGRVLIEVRGELDHYTAPLLEACLDGQIGRRRVRTVVVDLQEVTFLGLAGVAVLARARRRCLARGARLVVRCGGRRRVLRPLELTGLAPLVLEEEVVRRPGQRGPARRSSSRRRARLSPVRGRPTG
jgi:anti-sigma B factor antagonist